MNPLKIGTRGSPLAMWQANHVRQALLAAQSDLKIEIEVIRTAGDASPKAALTRLDGTGVFTKEIENALLDGRVDMAVHSLKDLPTRPADGLCLAAILEREDPADALVGRDGRTLAQLPAGAKVLTGSLRRRAQLLRRRPDLKIAESRGNIQTRLKKFDESDASALLLASAGLVRLGLKERITERFDPADFLPACGQGALAVETRADDERLGKLCRALDHLPTRLAVSAERAFLAALGGGCLVPVGAYGRMTGARKRLALTGMVAALDGSRQVQATVESAAGNSTDAVALGERLAEQLRIAGADEILRSFSLSS